jgi:hypothetical protein
MLLRVVLSPVLARAYGFAVRTDHRLFVSTPISVFTPFLSVGNLAGLAAAVFSPRTGFFLKTPHKLANGLRFAMNFPQPQVGAELNALLRAVSGQFYCLHLEAVAHNRRWLAQYLSRQGKEDDAMVMDLAADQADARLLITQGALIARSTSPGTA